MCPNCGYCPHCGRGGSHAQPYRWIGPTWIGGPFVPNVTGGNYLPPTAWTINTAAAQPNLTITTVLPHVNNGN